MKLLMMTGSYPPDVCGVGDYSHRLVQALSQKGVEASIYRQTDIENDRNLRAEVRRKDTICHIQYPAQGYGKKMDVQRLSFYARNSVVTIHEFSQAKLLRKLAELPFFFSAKKLIFTNQHELNSVSSVVPFLKSKSKVIPISTNILAPQNTVNVNRAGLLFFGLIRPNKGLEEFIECVRILHTKVSIPFVVCGAVGSGQKCYYEKIRTLSGDLPIRWELNKTESEVSKEMLSARYAYLSFPDGLTERRGSFLAALFHDITVLSNSGENTPKELLNSFLDVQTPEAAARIICDMEAGAVSAVNEIVLAQAKAHFSWDRIADLHIEIYKSML